MPTLILLRHGQSQWNLENRFTGWVDIDLAPKGVEEARRAGELLRDLPIDLVFTSVLMRAIRTAEIALETAGKPGLPMEKNQALNERHYGDLQGLNKDEMRKQFGNEQVHIWRRSYDTPPPNGESLKDTLERVLPYYEERIAPQLRAGKNVLIAAHGNSLRALVKHLEHISSDEITQLNIPTGVPRVYELDDNLEVTHAEYLGQDQH